MPPMGPPAPLTATQEAVGFPRNRQASSKTSGASAGQTVLDGRPAAPVVAARPHLGRPPLSSAARRLLHSQVTSSYKIGPPRVSPKHGEEELK